MKLTARGRKELARESTAHYIMVLASMTTAAGTKLEVLFRHKQDSTFKLLAAMKPEVTIDQAKTYIAKRIALFEEGN